MAGLSGSSWTRTTGEPMTGYEIKTVPIRRDSGILPRAKLGHASHPPAPCRSRASVGLLPRPGHVRRTLHHRPPGVSLQMGAEQTGLVPLR